MKHLATIQSEFLKQSRDWDKLSLEEQKDYLKRHPKSKRKITAKPKKIDQSLTNQLKQKSQSLNQTNPKFKKFKTDSADVPDTITNLFDSPTYTLSTGYNAGAEQGSLFNEFAKNLGYESLQQDMNGKPVNAWGPKLKIKDDWQQIYADDDNIYSKHKNFDVIVQTPKDLGNEASRMRSFIFGDSLSGNNNLKNTTKIKRTHDKLDLDKPLTTIGKIVRNISDRKTLKHIKPEDLQALKQKLTQTLPEESKNISEIFNLLSKASEQNKLNPISQQAFDTRSQLDSKFFRNEKFQDYSGKK